MTNHYARLRRSRGAWYEALLVNQSLMSDTSLDDLREYDEAAQAPEARAALVAVDNPAPARGYALLTPAGAEVLATVHVIENQRAEVYRALFSGMRVQADALVGGPGVPIVVSPRALAEHVAAAIYAHGEAYGVTIADIDGDARGGRELTAAEAIADQLEATGSVTIDALTADPEVVVEITAEVIPDDTNGEPEESEEQEPEPDGGNREPSGEEQGHPWDGKYVCQECGKTYKSAQGLGAHSKAHR